jgi:hypothetical protein
MSNQPPPYTRQFNFENYQTLNPTSPLPGDKVEAELNGARSSINQTISRLNEIQNADGSLKVPGALVAETNATATSVATSVATSTAQAYLAANYDPNVATDAAISASTAVASASLAGQYKQAAEINMVNAEAAAGLAQNAAIDSAIARSEARGHAIDANESRNEAHASAQAAAASYTNVGGVYNSALSLKNWIDSQSFQFVHKREDNTAIAANMLFNDGDADNSLIGNIFFGAQIDPNSVVTYPGPINNNGYNFTKGPWWVVGNPQPENPEVIIMRDMMNCLVQTWRTFGPNVTLGDMKAMEVGVNGQPDETIHDFSVMGKLIEPVVYTKQEFNTNQRSQLGTRKAALTPKGYVDQRDAEIMSAAQQASSTAETARDEVQQFRTSEYDNGRIYGPFEIVKFGSKLYWFKAFIGAAGYAPNTHPAAWTELSPQVDVSGFATENFVTSQGYLTAVPAGYATENFVTTRGYLTAVPSGYVQLNSNSGINIGGRFESEKGFFSYNTFNYSPDLNTLSPGKVGSADMSISNDNLGNPAIFSSQYQATITDVDTVGNLLPPYTISKILNITPHSMSASVGIDSVEQEAIAITPLALNMFVSANGVKVGFEGGNLNFSNGTIQDTAFTRSQFIVMAQQNPSFLLSSIEAAWLGGSTFTGKVTFNPASTIVPINIGHSSAPTSSIAGDLWLGTNTVSYKDATNTVRTLSVNGLSNVFSAPQTIDTTATTPALRVTQKGTGNVLLCEDSTNPDITALVVDAAGNVGVGVATLFAASSKLEVVGNTKSTTFSSGTGPTFNVNAVQSHSGGSDTHELVMSVNGSTYRIGMRFVSTP